MLAELNETIKPLISLSKGTHVSVYLDQSKGDDLQQSITNALDEIKEYLWPVMNKEQMDSFLRPLLNLHQDKGMLDQFQGSLGLFLNSSTFRILKIPIRVQTIVIVATSFHIKPLLKWMQFDREFLLLGVEGNCVSLYHGTQHNLRKIDPNESYSVPSSRHDPPTSKGPPCQQKLQGHLARYKHRLSNIISQKMIPIYVVGHNITRQTIIDTLGLRNQELICWTSSFREGKLKHFCGQIRKIQRQQADYEFENELEQYYIAEQQRKTSSSIDKIAKVALAGMVDTLIISDCINLFGRVDASTGNVVFHAAHENHEDDDVLDDLAQIVLAKGGTVVVAPRKKIPGRSPAVAILKYSKPANFNALIASKSFAISYISA